MPIGPALPCPSHRRQRSRTKPKRNNFCRILPPRRRRPRRRQNVEEGRGEGRNKNSALKRSFFDVLFLFSTTDFRRNWTPFETSTPRRRRRRRRSHSPKPPLLHPIPSFSLSLSLSLSLSFSLPRSCYCLFRSSSAVSMRPIPSMIDERWCINDRSDFVVAFWFCLRELTSSNN